jgi:TolA-binding protein
MPKLPDTQSTPLRRDAEVVKTLPDELSNAPADRAPRTPPHKGTGSGFRRHFEGYELGLATVGMVLTVALLALPRPSTPTTLPLPRADLAETRRMQRTTEELAALAETEGLPFEVRAVGEAIRHLGRSNVEGLDTSHDEDDIRARVKVVEGSNQAPLLLRLRAVQAEYFARALRQFASDGKQSADLDELGGDFVAHARKAGWLDAQRHFVADDATALVLFQLRWADLIGKRTTFPFSPSLNDWRVYYRFLLEHPDQGTAEPDARAADAARLQIVNALAKKDPDYPLEFAQGYLLFEMGDQDGAATAYRRYLGKHDGGPYTLLARNYLIYTLRGISSE